MFYSLRLQLSSEFKMKKKKDFRYRKILILLQCLIASSMLSRLNNHQFLVTSAKSKRDFSILCKIIRWPICVETELLHFC